MSETPQHHNKYGTPEYSAMNYDQLGSEPRSARLTKSLVWVMLVISALSTILGWVALQAAGAEQYLEQNVPAGQLQEITPDMLDTVFASVIVFYLVFALITLGLYVVVGLGLKGNKNWARVLGLILGILFLLSAAYTLLLGTDYGNLPGMELMNTILTVVLVLITVWWIIQAVNKDTNRWFTMHRSLQR